jgi:hypothetical protein
VRHGVQLKTIAGRGRVGGPPNFMEVT